MSVTPPRVSAVAVKMMFPGLSSTPDGAVEYAIREAGRSVDDSWLPEDQNLAVLYLSAHILTVRTQEDESGTGQRVSSETIGPISVRYEPAGDLPMDEGDLEATSYGRRFLQLARRNFPPILVC